MVGKGSTWRRGHHQRVKPNQPLTYRTERDPVLGCLMWLGATTRGGDPIVSHEGKNRLARHVEWEKVNGPIPRDHELRSSCKRRKCIEPAHLELRRAPSAAVVSLA
jgi:hypothetical protein